MPSTSSPVDAPANRFGVVNRLLEKDTDEIAGVRDREIPYIDAPDLDRTTLGVVEAAQQLEKRGLSSSVDTQ